METERTRADEHERDAILQKEADVAIAAIRKAKLIRQVQDELERYRMSDDDECWHIIARIIEIASRA